MLQEKSSNLNNSLEQIEGVRNYVGKEVQAINWNGNNYMNVIQFLNFPDSLKVDTDLSIKFKVESNFEGKKKLTNRTIAFDSYILKIDNQIKILTSKVFNENYSLVDIKINNEESTKN